MAEKLHLKLEINDKEALLDVHKLKTALEKLGQASENAGKKEHFKKYRTGAALSSALTTNLGRKLDELNNRFGEGSDQVKKFVASQLKNNGVLKVQRGAINNLKTAYKNGEIGLEQYRLEMQKAAKTQQLFQNKLAGATPIRRMGRDLRGIGSLLSDLNPMWGGAVGQIANFSDRLMDARESLGGTREGLAGLQGKEGIGGLLGKINPLTAAVVGLGIAFATTTIKFKSFIDQSREASKQLESQVISTASVFNTTLQFRDEFGKPLELDQNFQKSLEQADQVVKQLLIDSAKLTNVEFADLTSGLTVAAPYLGQLGATGVKDQAEAVGALVTALKTLKPTATEIEQSTEIRAILSGDFGSSRSDLARNLLARTGKTADQMKALFAEAKQAGQGVQFLNEQFKPLIDSVKLGSNSLSNLESVLRTVKQVAQAETGDQFRDLSKTIVQDLTLGLEEGRASGIFESLGQAWKNVLEATAPLMKPLQDSFWNLIETTSQLISLTGVLARLATPLLGNMLGGINNLFQPLNALLELAVSFIDTVLHGGKEIEQQQTDTWKRISDSVTNALRFATGVVRAFGEDSGAVIIRLQAMFGNLMDMIPAYMKIALGKSIQALADFINVIPEPLKQLLGITAISFETAGQNQLNQAIEGLKASYESLKNLDSVQISLQGAESKTKPAEEEDKKAKRAAEQEAKRLESAQKALQVSERELELSKEKYELVQKNLEEQNKFFQMDQGLKNLEAIYASEENSLKLQKSRIQHAVKMGHITEEEGDRRSYIVEQKELDLRKDRELLKVQEKKNDLIEEEERLKSIIASRDSEKANIESRISDLEQLKQGKPESAVVKLQTEINKLTKELANIEIKANEEIQKTQNRIQGLQSQISIDTKGIDERFKVEQEELNNQYSETMANAAEEHKNKLVEGAKAIAGQMTNAFQDGKISIQEGFQIAESILSKISNLFSGGQGGVGGLLSGLGGLGGLFGGGGGGLSAGLQVGQSWQRDANENWQIFDQAGNVLTSFNSSCLKAAKSAAGFGGELQGLGGMLGGLASGGGGGALGFLSGGLSTALSVGSSIFSAFSSRRKKKREAWIKSTIDKVQRQTRAAYNRIDEMERALQRRLDAFQLILSDLNREIRKIDVDTSLFLGQEVIKKTRQQIEETIRMIGEGTQLVIEQGIARPDKYNALVTSAIHGLDDAATGLFAERNKQLEELWQAHENARRVLLTDGRQSSEISAAMFDQMEELSQKMRDVNDSFNSQVADMTEQRKDLQEQLEQAIEEQKRNYIHWKQKVERARYEITFGEAGGSMFDDVVDAVDQIREIMLSGIDPAAASFLVERIKEKTKQKLQDSYRDFLEGSSNSYLSELKGLQDEYFSIISEGRITGQIKRSQEDRLLDVQRRLKSLNESQIESSVIDLEEFGQAITGATDLLENMTEKLAIETTRTALEVQAGQYRAIDAIDVNLVTPPEVIASQIEKMIDQRFSTQVLTGVQV